MQVRILIADDHALIGEALAATLCLVHEFVVVGVVSQPDDLMVLAARVLPSVVILDAAMSQGTGGGLDLAARLSHDLPACGVALLAARPTRALIQRAIATGVLSVVPKHARMTHLIDAVRGVAAGCLTLDPALIARTGSTTSTLSDREREILRLTATGASLKEISNELFLATGTVRNLASAAIRKVNGRNRFDAAMKAQAFGLI